MQVTVTAEIARRHEMTPTMNVDDSKSFGNFLGRADLLTDEDTNHLQTFFAVAQVFDLVLFENLTLGDDFIQLPVVDVIGLHGDWFQDLSTQ